MTLAIIPAHPVIPAKAGIQSDSPSAPRATNACWIPASAGMTGDVK
jgi:hypothetical protein